MMFSTNEDSCPDCCGACEHSTYPYGVINKYDFPSEKEYRTLCRLRKQTGRTKLRCGSETCPKFERRCCANCGKSCTFDDMGNRAGDFWVFCAADKREHEEEEEHGCWRH